MRESFSRSRSWLGFSWLGLLLLATPLLTACGRSAANTDQAQLTAKADEILRRMVDAYQQADSYADSAQVRLRFARGVEIIDQAADFAVSFERPNKLRMHVYGANVVCDGTTFFATVSSLAGEVLQVDAPAAITNETLYTHELLTAELTGGFAGGSVQLAFLVDPNAMQAILDGAAGATLGEPAAIDGSLCHRVSVPRTDGELVFWIDQSSHVVRRLEYPTQELERYLESTGPVSDLSLTADFVGARLDEPVDPVAFQFSVPADAKLVEAFIVRPPLPRPLPPSELLGKSTPPFSFAAPAGEAVTRESLAGKIAVLDFWFTTCPPCEVSMPLLERVYQKYRDRVEFVAVSIDDSEVTDEQLRARLDEWGVSMPIARDREQYAASAFAIPGAPSMFVLGADGRVQDSEVGLNPNLIDDLSETLDRLLAGEDAFMLARRRYDARVADYKDAVARQETEASTTITEIPRADIAKRSDPRTVKLAKLWSVTDLKEPGNVLVVESEEGDSRLFVVDGWNAVAELDKDGQVLKRHELPISETSIVKFLRTAVDGEGRRFFVGAASVQQQLHLFDADWRLTLSYPAEGTHDGVADVQLADLDGDGELELNVSYWGSVGVQNASLDGKRRWANRSIEQVYGLAVSGADDEGRRRLLSTHSRGTVMPIDHEGRNGEEAAVGGRYLVMIAAADLDGDGRPELCGVARDPSNRETVIGLGDDLTEQWSYNLPYGVHQHAIEMITSGKLISGEPGHWVIAGADGSIHFLAADGVLLDEFHYGAALTGVAVAEVDGAGVLVVATPSTVDAWNVESLDAEVAKAE